MVGERSECELAETTISWSEVKEKSGAEADSDNDDDHADVRAVRSGGGGVGGPGAGPDATDTGVRVNLAPVLLPCCLDRKTR